MSSIITDMIDCPQCGLPSQKDEYYVVGEERVTCNWCGYTHVKSIKGTESSKGYGSIHYVPKENGSNESENIVKLKLPLSIVHRHQIVVDIKENFDTEKSSFFVWNDEEKRLECLVGNKPSTIEEMLQQQKEEADYYKQCALSCTLEECEEF